MKIIAIVWQSYYNILRRAAKNLENFVEIQIHSARALQNNPQRLQKVISELTSVDLLFLYRSSEPFWDEVDKLIKSKELKGSTICLSHDPTYWTLSTVRPEVVSRAYAYLVVNGEENMTNMLKFLASEEVGILLDYDPPKEILWEGLYHPRANGIFTDIGSFLNWYDTYWREKNQRAP